MKKCCGNCAYFTTRTKMGVCKKGGYIGIKEHGYPIGYLTRKEVKYYKSVGRDVISRKGTYFVTHCKMFEFSFEDLMKKIIKEEDGNRRDV